MKVTSLHRTIVRRLEPLPIASYDSKTASLFERLQIRLGEAVTGILRWLRPGAPIVWDPWILKDGELYRLFYLQALKKYTPWWTVSHICGAVSRDLSHWEDLGVILDANPDNDWESGRVCAGCTYAEEGVYYLFYSAGGKEPPHLRNEAIGLATSTDGVHYTRISDRPLIAPAADSPWYGRSSWTDHLHWRDPFVYKDEASGKYYVFICASSRVSGKFQGCVGLAVADQITGPYEILPPVVDVPVEASAQWPYYHLERPQVLYRNGQYHLFFSCFKQFFDPSWLETVNKKKITNSSLYWYVSDRLTGPYEPVNQEDFVVAGSETTGLYGINFLEISEDPEELIAYGWYHRLQALEVSPSFRVHWKPSNGTNLLETLEIVPSAKALAAREKEKET
ncbi:MAG: family 43 glycosylhydrolase [Cyanophyceae cyanobacterium]